MARADNSLYGTFIRVLKKVGPKKKFAGSEPSQEGLGTRLTG